MRNEDIKIGDVFLVEFDGIEHEIKGCRPAVVVQNNLGNINSPNVQIIPISSSMAKAKLPTHVYLYPDGKNGLNKVSIAQCESQRLRTKSCLKKILGKLSDKDMETIAIATIVSTPLVAYLEEQVLLKVRLMTKQKNKIKKMAV